MAAASSQAPARALTTRTPVPRTRLDASLLRTLPALPPPPHCYQDGTNAVPLPNSLPSLYRPSGARRSRCHTAARRRRIALLTPVYYLYTANVLCTSSALLPAALASWAHLEEHFVGTPLRAPTARRICGTLHLARHAQDSFSNLSSIRLRGVYGPTPAERQRSRTLRACALPMLLTSPKRIDLSSSHRLFSCRAHPDSALARAHTHHCRSPHSLYTLISDSAWARGLPLSRCAGTAGVLRV